jgi:Protein of unknown function (DUF1579)
MAEVTLTKQHMDLHDFVGEWVLSQKVWTDPKGKPIEHRGKSKCTAILDGRATLMTTEMETEKFKGVALMTYDQKESKFDLAWLDTVSDNGILMMVGQGNKAPSHSTLQAEFGPKTTLVRQWQSAIVNQAACVQPPVLEAVARQASGGVQAAVETAPVIPVRLQENKVSNDKWVLEFYVPGADGTQFLMQQNTFTRAA